MKVVFDTNILVSALVFPGGRGEAALVRILQEQDHLLLSKAILDELLGVLARKFSRDAEELARIAVFLADLATTVQPRQTLKIRGRPTYPSRRTRPGRTGSCDLY